MHSDNLLFAQVEEISITWQTHVRQRTQSKQEFHLFPRSLSVLWHIITEFLYFNFYKQPRPLSVENWEWEVLLSNKSEVKVISYEDFIPNGFSNESINNWMMPYRTVTLSLRTKFLGCQVVQNLWLVFIFQQDTCFVFRCRYSWNSLIVTRLINRHLIKQ